MDDYISDGIMFLEPWEPIGTNNLYFEKELYKEVGEKHKLYKTNLKAVAKNCDDVLFSFDDGSNNYAVVHLTWRGKQEKEEQYPLSRIFSSLEDWVATCMISDYLQYVDIAHTFEVIDSRRRINNEIALLGSFTSIIKPGCYIIDDNNFKIFYNVKGIETLNYIDKSREHINPWVIVVTDTLKPGDFIGRKFIIGTNE